jgi:hypothetical protein
MKKIILCRGSALYPARFWWWGVGYENEYTDKDKENGYIISACRKYLTKEQIEFLDC